MAQSTKSQQFSNRQLEFSTAVRALFMHPNASELTVADREEIWRLSMQKKPATALCRSIAERIADKLEGRRQVA
jgi:hypothetical protein